MTKEKKEPITGTGKREVILPNVHDPTRLIVGGKEYRLVRNIAGKTVHDGKLIFRPVDKEKSEKRMNEIVDYIESNCSNDLSVRGILFEAVRVMSEDSLAKLEKKMKAKVKPTVNKGHCMSIEFGGNDFVQLV